MGKSKHTWKRIIVALWFAVMMTLMTGLVAQAAAPAQVTIASKSAGESQVSFKWNQVSNAASYNIYVKVGSGEKTLLKTRSASKSTSVRITNLKNKVTYKFYVSAVNSEGEEGKKSKVIKLTPTVKKPGKVQGLTITKVKKTSVTLTWDAESLATKYIIEQKLSDGTYKRLTTTTKTTITLKGLTTGTSYEIGVRAYRKAGGASAKGYLSTTVSFVPQTAAVAIQSIHPYDTTTYTTNSSIVYPANVAEAYVNAQKWRSDTKYLIWVNTYTQHMYIFKGSQGNWKLKKRYLCSTGANGSTWLGLMLIRGKEAVWKFSSQQYAYWASNIDTGAIHSELYYPSGAKWSLGVLGTAASHGCIRLEITAAKYVYDTVPIGTYLRIW